MSSPEEFSPLGHSAKQAVREVADRIRQRVVEKEPLPIKQLLFPLFLQASYSSCLRADSLGFWTVGERRYWMPRFTFQRTQIVKPRLKIGIFAGIHGDEPAGIFGLMDFIRDLDHDPEIGRAFEFSIYPICNPSGYHAGTRESASGKDLNREFWRDSSEPEVGLLEREITRKKFDGIIALHSDDTCDGFYGYARGSVLATQLLAPALTAAERAQPRDARAVIDGFHAVNGIIHTAYDGILSAPLTQTPQPFEIILESPALTDFDQQRRAFVLALESIISEYRHFITYGGDL